MQRIKPMVFWFLGCVGILFAWQGPALAGNDPAGLPLVIPDLAPCDPNLLGFNPGDYHFLLYIVESEETALIGAMNILGIAPSQYTVKSPPDTLENVDFSDYDIVIVGWHSFGFKPILPAAIAEGITGRIILTGHDLDLHTVQELGSAGILLRQAIAYILDGVGTGLLVCGDEMNCFDWLPPSWGVGSVSAINNSISSITEAGYASGVYDDPYRPGESITTTSLSGWNDSYHNKFTISGDYFEVWELGNNDQHNVTIAAPRGVVQMDLVKTTDIDPNDCVEPGDTITYTIQWTNTTGLTLDDAWLLDFLPRGVTYPEGFASVDPNLNIIEADPAYDPNTHTYLWELGPMYPNDSGSVQLEVVVNTLADSGLTLLNQVELWGVIDDRDGAIALTVAETQVCCFGETPTEIYVDRYATGLDAGTSWADAYHGPDGLQKALYRAAHAICTEPYVIYVAQGTYLPGNRAEDSFELPEGISVYGGFPTGGCAFEQRDPRRYETILTGQLDDDLPPDCDTIVTMLNEVSADPNSPIDETTLLEGFTITKALQYGIYGEGVDFVVNKCVIQNSSSYGIYASNGDVAVKWCKIQNNGYDGIHHVGENYALTVENCWILRSQRYGIYCDGSTPMIKNSIISESDLANEGRQGISIFNPTYSPVIYNNTISNNKSAGIFFSDDGNIADDPNQLDYPDIQNCIIYYNNSGGNQLAGLNADLVAHYCCIQDCNSVNSTNISLEPGFAYTVDPNGTPNTENYHLAYNSICKDLGNPYLNYDDQADMDNEERVLDLRIDIGADEIYSCDDDISEDDLFNDLDWNVDGVINLYEFNGLSAAWLGHDPNDPAWQADPNLVNPNAADIWKSACNLDATGASQYAIDIPDLAAFCDEWLWQACWRENYLAYSSAMAGGGEMVAMTVPMFETLSTSLISEADAYVPVNPYAELSRAELARLAINASEIIGYIEAELENEPDNAEALIEGLEFLQSILSDIREVLQSHLDMKPRDLIQSSEQSLRRTEL